MIQNIICIHSKLAINRTNIRFDIKGAKNNLSHFREIESLVKKNKITSAVAKKLKAKKKYYVRIRTYKKVGKQKIYSNITNSIKNAIFEYISKKIKQNSINNNSLIKRNTIANKKLKFA